MLRYNQTRGWELTKLAAHLRREDLVEVVLATGKLPIETLTRRVIDTEGAMTFTMRAPDRALLAIFGSFPSPCCEGQGVAWMLCTLEIEDYSLSVMKSFPAMLDAIAAPYEALTAHMWAGNRMHAKWASAMGFLHEPSGDVVIHDNRFLKIIRPKR